MGSDTHKTADFNPATAPLSGTRLIEASAGTGKTYTLASLYLRLVLAGYKVDQILVVTFTEAATAELRDRIRARLREALAAVNHGKSDDPFLTRLLESADENPDRADWRLRVALSGFDEAAIFTIHAFCRRMLVENAFESNIIFDPELVTDSGPLYEEIVSDFWALETYGAPTWVVRFLEQNKLSPTSLTPLVRQVAAQPDRKLLPEHTAAMAFDEFQKLYGEARQIWRTQKDEIVHILETDRGINRRSYSKKNLPRWLADVGAYFESEDIPSTIPDVAVDKFTQRRIADKAPKNQTPPRHPFFMACEALRSFPERWLLAFKFRLLEYARRELRDRKTERSIQFFDDLIHQLKSAVDGLGGKGLARRIRERFTAALIDEFQDTDQAQYHIFKRIYTGTDVPFFLIGDPKQSIYAFRGADIFAYLKAVHDTRGRTHSLAVNWRSDPTLLKAVNALFSRVDHPFIYHDIAFSQVAPRVGARDLLYCGGLKATPMRVLFVPRKGMGLRDDKVINKTDFKRLIPQLVASDISRLLSGDTVIDGQAEEKVHPGHIAVLVRTNLQARQAQAALRQLGIPSVLASAESVFKSNEALDLLRTLRAVADPADTFRVRAALSTDLFGLTGFELLHLTEDDRQWEIWANYFRDWHRLWQSGGFIQMLQKVFAFRPGDRTQPLLTTLLELTDGERRVTNIQHLAELLHEAVRNHHLGTQGLLRWFGRQLADDRPSSEAFELRLESDERAVQLITIHKAKGLEYPVVYIPYAWQGTPMRKPAPPVSFHDPDKDFAPICDLGSEQLAAHARLAREEETAENMRLLYVALTRARHQSTVIWGAAKDARFSPLGRLLYTAQENTDPLQAGKQIADLSDEEIRIILDTLATDSNGAIGIETTAEQAGVHFIPERPEPATLEKRNRQRELKRQWRQVSFSGLVSERAVGTSHAQDRVHDYDIAATASIPAVEQETDGTIKNTPQIVLHDFDRGPRAGNFFHAVYENLDFHGQSAEGLAGCVNQELAAFSYDPKRWIKPVSQAVSDTLVCPLDADVPALRLDRIPMRQRFNELEFVFPVAQDATSSRTPVTASSLTEAVAAANIPPGYTQKLHALGFVPVNGFMKGFIDLVFEFEGRWHIIDYKSNFLGERYRDYSPGALENAMAEHHYYLQYHIYTVALHRYLARRLSGYDYDRHFGGVYYLFIRGMSPEVGAGCGIYRDRPAKKVIEDLSTLFVGG